MFSGSSTTEYPENFIDDLKNVFNVIYVVDTARVYLDAYHIKGVTRTWFDQWKQSRDEDGPPRSWVCFEEAFLGLFFP